MPSHCHSCPRLPAMRSVLKMIPIRFIKNHFLFAFGSTLFLYYLLHQYSLIISEQNRPRYRPKLISSGSSKQWCQFPKLDIDHPSVVEYFSSKKHLKCSKEKNWVYIRNGTFYIDSDAETRYAGYGSKIICDYTDIRRVSDFENDMKKEENFQNGSKLKGDFSKIDCHVDGTSITYSNYHAGVVRSEEALERSQSKSMPPNALGLNVYMFGFDSTSRLGFVRNLPKMYEYWTEKMDAIVLEGYNIVGDGTPQALIPILTGKTEEELPLTRKRFANASYVNVYPWIWNEYRDAGYVTMFGEDAVKTGTFTFRLKGFKEQPTDHYMRPFYLAAEEELTEEEIRGRLLCLGSEGQHQVHFDYVQHFWNAYPDITPKFTFQFHDSYSHGSYNLLQVVDNYMVDYLKFFVDNGHWNNTIFIVMADHGPRIGDLRATTQGKLEERLPFFSFAFPPWFKIRYPDTFRVFRENAARLTTPFDIHATLQEILNFNPKPKSGSVKKRSLSLFHPIPIDRTCDQAGIEVHWCTCLQWSKVPINNSIVQLVASHLVKAINEKTQVYRNSCAEIHLSKISNARKYKPVADLLKYKGIKDLDGFVPDLSGKVPKFSLEYYQLEVWTEPGEAHCEASITWDKDSKKSTIDLDLVSHMNRYGDQPHCIVQKDASLVKWCKCYDKI